MYRCSKERITHPKCNSSTDYIDLIHTPLFLDIFSICRIHATMVVCCFVTRVLVGKEKRKTVRSSPETSQHLHYVNSNSKNWDRTKLSWLINFNYITSNVPHREITFWKWLNNTEVTEQWTIKARSTNTLVYPVAVRFLSLVALRRDANIIELSSQLNFSVHTAV